MCAAVVLLVLFCRAPPDLELLTLTSGSTVLHLQQPNQVYF
jgi:hypothetical protein